MTRARRVIAWTLFVASAVGLVINLVLWLLGNIGDRTMIGITMTLAWFSLMFTSFTSVQIAHHDD